MYEAFVGQLVMIRDGFRLWALTPTLGFATSLVRYSNDEIPCVVIKERAKHSVYCVVLCGTDVLLVDTEALLPL